MKTNYLDVSELAGEEVAEEQLNRLCNRYYWAGTFCSSRDVLEVACGTGQGLGYLASISRRLVAGDVSPDMIEIAKKHYGDRIDIRQFDAQKMPFKDKFFDVIIIFEAIYYIPDVNLFIKECKRVLRDKGQVLIVTANKDLYDFNPSPYSYKYFGTVELNDIFSRNGFTVQCYGDTPVESVSLRQRVLRPVKLLAVKLHLMPKSMKGKKIFKRLVFGSMTEMPAEIDGSTSCYIEPRVISNTEPDKEHKVIFCTARLK